MKVIVAGSRTIKDYVLVKRFIESTIEKNNINMTELISGGADGVDKLGERWALEKGLKIKRFIPDWSIGKHAGIIRNKDMANYGDVLIVVHDGKSKGTQHMIKSAEDKGLNVYRLTVYI